MNSQERSSNSTCDEKMHIPERELFAFICAVEQLFGPEQARLSMEDWLAELERMDGLLDQVVIGERCRLQRRQN